ncbi:MAG: stage II sporulation protein M [Anaerolineales bacterium]|nr:stage II sporulation protein M [Anaerolineales bacterium]
MWDSIKPALIITRREVRDQLRDWRIIAPILILTLFFPGLMNIMAGKAVGFVEQYGASIIGDRLIPYLLMVVGFFPITVSLVIALESFVGEKERGSIEPLLTSPLSDWQLYLGKLMAVVIPPLMGSYLGISVYLVGVYRSVGWVPPLDLLIQILVITFVQALVMVSGAVVISTQTTSVRAANLLASFVIVPVALLIIWESNVMFWGQYAALWWVVLGLVIIAGLLIRTGIGHFNREELLGRELDVLNFRWLWKTFVTNFKGEATSVGSWFTVEIPRTLKKMRLPALLVLGMLIVAMLIGANLTEQFVVPPELVAVDEFGGGSIEGLDQLSLFTTQGIPIIWLHNLRAILLATLAGLFTYSVLGLLLLMLPFVIIGFLVATIASAGIPAGKFLVAFVLPHGIFEIPAIVLCGAAILRVGGSLAALSKNESIGEGLLRSLADWVKIVLGVVVPLLLVAAIMEALVTPRFGLWFLSL